MQRMARRTAFCQPAWVQASNAPGLAAVKVDVHSTAWRRCSKKKVSSSRRRTVLLGITGIPISSSASNLSAHDVNRPRSGNSGATPSCRSPFAPLSGRARSLLISTPARTTRCESVSSARRAFMRAPGDPITTKGELRASHGIATRSGAISRSPPSMG